MRGAIKGREPSNEVCPVGWEVSNAPDGDGAAATERSGARGRANLGGATGGGLARGARGKGRAEERDGGRRCNGGHDLQSKRVSEIHGCSRSCDSRWMSPRRRANVTSSPANRIARGDSRIGEDPRSRLWSAVSVKVKGTHEAHNRKQTPPRRRLGFTQGSRPSDLGRARREPSSSSATFRT